MSLDIKHNEVTGRVTDVSMTDESPTRCEVSFESSDEERDFEAEDYRTWRFGMSQLVKFAGLRKKDLKTTDDEGNEILRDDAREMILEGLQDEESDTPDELVFKFDPKENEILSVVSPNYVTVPSDELDDLVNQTLGSLGITGENMNRSVRRRGFVVEVDYTWDAQNEIEEVGDTVNGGISIRNSVFGASSLRVNKFYTILACQNGMRIKDTEKSFKQIHMGDADELREAFVNEVEMQVESLWEETELIKTVGLIDFPFQDQVEYIEKLADNGKITKRSAGTMVAHIIDENDLDRDDFEDTVENLKVPDAVPGDWNVERENAWNLVNVLTGYATHSDMVSDSGRKKIERVYDNILKAEDKGEVLEVAQ